MKNNRIDDYVCGMPRSLIPTITWETIKKINDLHAERSKQCAATLPRDLLATCLIPSSIFSQVSLQNAARRLRSTISCLEHLCIENFRFRLLFFFWTHGFFCRVQLGWFVLVGNEAMVPGALRRGEKLMSIYCWWIVGWCCCCVLVGWDFFEGFELCGVCTSWFWSPGPRCVPSYPREIRRDSDDQNISQKIPTAIFVWDRLTTREDAWYRDGLILETDNTGYAFWQYFAASVLWFWKGIIGVINVDDIRDSVEMDVRGSLSSRFLIWWAWAARLTVFAGEMARWECYPRWTQSIETSLFELFSVRLPTWRSSMFDHYRDPVFKDGNDFQSEALSSFGLGSCTPWIPLQALDDKTKKSVGFIWLGKERWFCGVFIAWFCFRMRDLQWRRRKKQVGLAHRPCVRINGRGSSSFFSTLCCLLSDSFAPLLLMVRTTVLVEWFICEVRAIVPTSTHSNIRRGPGPRALYLQARHGAV